MKIVKEHIEYLKDNPEGYWFKRKLYGYGWTPARPAGWITIGVYLVFLVGVVMYAHDNIIDTETPTRIIALIISATVLLLVVTWRTGEPLKWQWGKNEPRH